MGTIKIGRRLYENVESFSISQVGLENILSGSLYDGGSFNIPIKSKDNGFFVVNDNKKVWCKGILTIQNKLAPILEGYTEQLIFKSDLYTSVYIDGGLYGNGLNVSITVQATNKFIKRATSRKLKEYKNQSHSLIHISGEFRDISILHSITKVWLTDACFRRIELFGTDAYMKGYVGYCNAYFYDYYYDKTLLAK